jgi:hypothetical protein
MSAMKSSQKLTVLFRDAGYEGTNDNNKINVDFLNKEGTCNARCLDMWTYWKP